MGKSLSIERYGNNIKNTLKNRPVESILILLVSIAVCLLNNSLDGLIMESTITIACIMLPLSYILNETTKGTTTQTIYLLTLPLTLLSIYACLDWETISFNTSTEYLTIVAELLMACTLVNNLKSDYYIVESTVSICWAGIKAFLFITPAAVALYAIACAFDKIFGIEIYHFCTTLPWTLFLPILTITIFDSNERVKSIDSEIANGILNYIMTGAMITYTIIFYLYILKIVLTWTLPQGGVVTMCFWYMVLCVASSCLYRMAQSSKFDWFYHSIIVITSPMVILFWVAAIRRVYDYGLTENRVYMLTMGIIDLILGYMVITNKDKAIGITFIHSMGFFFILGLIPPLSAKNIASWCQWTNATPTEYTSEEEDIYGRIKTSKDISISEFKSIKSFSQFEWTDSILYLFNNEDTIVKVKTNNIPHSIANHNDISTDSLIQRAYEYKNGLDLTCQTNDSTSIVFDDIVICNGKVIYGIPRVILSK